MCALYNRYAHNGLCDRNQVGFRINAFEIHLPFGRPHSLPACVCVAEISTFNLIIAGESIVDLMPGRCLGGR